MTLIPADRDEPIIECGSCIYTRFYTDARVEVRADAYDGRGAPPGQPGWEIVLGDSGGSVVLAGRVENVTSGIKKTQYRIHIEQKK